MILPSTVCDISALERDLSESGIRTEAYLPYTLQMKEYLHLHSLNGLDNFETLMRRELGNIFTLIREASAN